MDLKNATIKIFTARVFKSITSFVAIVVFSRELGADPLGVYYPFVALLGVALLPSDLGIASSVKKRLSENRQRKQFVGAALLMKLPLISVVAIIVLIASNHVNQFLGAELAIIFIIVLYIDGIGGLSMHVLHGELRVGEAAILEVIRPLSWLVFGYIFVMQGLRAEGLVYGYFIGSVLITIVGWWKVSVLPALPNKEHIYSLFDFAKYSAVSSIGGLFYSWMDVLVLTLFVTMGIRVARGDIGAYENAWRLSLIVMLAAKAIATVLFPQMSEWDTQGARNKIESTLPTAVFASLLLVIPGFVGIFILSNDLLRILFGSEFTVAGLALIILAGGKIPMAIHILFNNALNALDRPDLPAISAIISAGLNLIFNIIFIWQYGLAGAAIATVGSFVINTLIHTYYLNMFLDIRLPFRKIGWITISSIVMGIIIYYISNIVEINGLLSLAIVITTGVGVYTSMLLIPTKTRVELVRMIPDRWITT